MGLSRRLYLGNRAMAKLLAKLGEVNAKIVSSSKGKAPNWVSLGALFSANNMSDQVKVELREGAKKSAATVLAKDVAIPDTLSLEASSDDLMAKAKAEVGAEFGKDANVVAMQAKSELDQIRRIMDAVDVVKIGNKTMNRNQLKDPAALSSIDWALWGSRLPKSYVDKVKGIYDSIEPPETDAEETAALKKMSADMTPLAQQIAELRTHIQGEIAGIKKTQAELVKRDADYYGTTPIEQLLDEHPEWAETVFAEIEAREWDPAYDPKSTEPNIGWPAADSDAGKYFADSMPKNSA